MEMTGRFNALGVPKSPLRSMREDEYARTRLTTADLDDPEVLAVVKDKEIARLEKLLSEHPVQPEYDTFLSFGQGLSLEDMRDFQKKLVDNADFSARLQSLLQKSSCDPKPVLEKDEDGRHYIRFQGKKGKAKIKVEAGGQSLI